MTQNLGFTPFAATPTNGRVVLFQCLLLFDSEVLLPQFFSIAFFLYRLSHHSLFYFLLILILLGTPTHMCFISGNKFLPDNHVQHTRNPDGAARL